MSNIELAERLHDAGSERWQMISRDKSDVFGMIRGDATFLSTVDLSFYIGGYKYETCIFMNGDSEVLRRYKTKAEAMVGHIELAEKYNLK